MKTRVCMMVMAGMIGAGAAWADTATPAQVDALIEDINAHKQLCDKVQPSETELFQQCAKQQATLVARQQKLGVSNDVLNSKLKTRGWRWP
jgi:hypothetical protein